MKTKIIPLTGDLKENLYQLGMKEKYAFERIEERVTRLLSTSDILRQGRDIISRARAGLKKKKDLSFFEECVAAYAEGMKIEPSRYMSFLSLFEIAAHYGQIYPELKGLLPGCTSVFHKRDNEFCHARLLDFPLTGIFDDSPRLYYWKTEGKPSFLSYSCEGLAPLFFQGVHEKGISFAIHHKPGHSFHKDGESIFQIAFETMFNVQSMTDVKREVRKKTSMTKWCFLMMDKDGLAKVIDMDGPAITSENYQLTDRPLIFTNIPLQNDQTGFENFLSLCEDRQKWISEKLTQKKTGHVLDIITDINQHSEKKWLHPGATLSTIAAYQVNLTRGYIDLKESNGAIVKADAMVRIDLSKNQSMTLLKEAETMSDAEKAWKLASVAQSDYDQGHFAEAYHHLQMAEALMPHKIWKNIFSFYICLWDFRFVANENELRHVYKRVKHIKLPEKLRGQWSLFMMRLEKKLDLSQSQKIEDLDPVHREIFQLELDASRPVFSTWMKLLYPRLEILDVFSPHDQK